MFKKVPVPWVHFTSPVSGTLPKQAGLLITDVALIGISAPKRVASVTP